MCDNCRHDEFAPTNLLIISMAVCLIAHIAAGRRAAYKCHNMSPSITCNSAASVAYVPTTKNATQVGHPRTSCAQPQRPLCTRQVKARYIQPGTHKPLRIRKPTAGEINCSQPVVYSRQQPSLLNPHYIFDRHYAIDLACNGSCLIHIRCVMYEATQLYNTLEGF